ncbi:hypothetical protein [Blastomonas sp. CCH5-A3]|jgi:hypothetical protein|uniref:hypothetical protein n=1 Tax=Blastomonas sp. CCH5-A3 TaxID=1768761 RepID=UPI000B129B3D|nr:hypothetical protein [Blastomonas sp. CCH5-A3]|tara:strand:- start:60498 stop:60929 length:432 start_codon:yes stop_codon:yes gene_type:complete
MAITDLRAESAPVITPNRFPPAAAALIAARMLNRHSASKIAQAIDVLLDVLDLIDGDPDLEPNGDDEPTGDERDCAYVEWTTLHHRHRVKANVTLGLEDDEQDDWDEDSHDQEAIDEREEHDDEDACDVPPIWPGEGCAPAND